MSHSGDSKVSAVLQAAQAGDRQAVADLLPLVYAELHELAQAQLARRPPGQTRRPPRWSTRCICGSRATIT